MAYAWSRNDDFSSQITQINPESEFEPRMNAKTANLKLLSILVIRNDAGV
jgi:hypothetical protein